MRQARAKLIVGSFGCCRRTSLAKVGHRGTLIERLNSSYTTNILFCQSEFLYQRFGLWFLMFPGDLDETVFRGISNYYFRPAY